MKCYMAVTADKYELPLYVADNVKDLSNKFNVSENCILSSISKEYKHSRLGRIFVKVNIDDEEV